MYFAAGGAVSAITAEFAKGCVTRIQRRIEMIAETEALSSRDFACTLLTAVVGMTWAAYWQIGDGAIVVSEPETPDEYGVIHWPEKHEYENVTEFVTQPDAAQRLVFVSAGQHAVEVALLTDGIQRIALDFQHRNAHAPFFKSLFGLLREQDEGYSTSVSTALARFLDLPRVNERTDDDKTLVLASRRESDSA